MQWDMQWQLWRLQKQRIATLSNLWRGARHLPEIPYVWDDLRVISDSVSVNFHLCASQIHDFTALWDPWNSARPYYQLQDGVKYPKSSFVRLSDANKWQSTLCYTDHSCSRSAQNQKFWITIYCKQITCTTRTGRRKHVIFFGREEYNTLDRLVIASTDLRSAMRSCVF